MPDAYILGIESSCDETGAAVVRSGEQILSNVVASQIATHQPYGGVVPELASREHLRAIVPVVRQALAEAGQTYQSVDAIAVTQGPGLAGALLVGISFAKALASRLEKPLIAVNHLEGHIHAVLLEQRQSESGELAFSGAGAGGFGRAHASLSCPGARESLDLPEHRPHSRRRRRRGVR
jgi:N6-L-threonylcarbamoyladenine synthase